MASQPSVSGSHEASFSSILCWSCTSLSWKTKEVSYGDFGMYLEPNLQQAKDQQLKLREIKARSSECALCALVYDFIKGAGTMTDELLDRRIILSGFRDERARGQHGNLVGTLTEEMNEQRAHHRQGHLSLSWIVGIRVAFEDYDRTDVEKDYPLLCLYVPLGRAPDKANFSLFSLGVVLPIFTHVLLITVSRLGLF